MLISPHSNLLFIGDSITDCDRSRPIGEDYGLGNGYVSLINALLGSTYRRHRIRIINVGTSGNTIRDLNSRWQTDVLNIKPDWLSVMIGINDVWRQFDSPMQTGMHVSLEEYQSTFETLISKTKPQLKGLVLMTPYFIEPNRSDPMRAMMDQYGVVVRELAQRYDAILVDTQDAFDNVLAELHPMALAGDRVHPNLTGHMILAQAFLKAVDFS